MIRTTGAVVMGRQTYEMADDPDFYAERYEFKVPIFVLTHELPDKQTKSHDKLTFTFVGGVESVIGKARAAASSQNVTVVGGATLLQQCPRRGLNAI